MSFCRSRREKNMYIVFFLQKRKLTEIQPIKDAKKYNFEKNFRFFAQKGYF